jgi:hypothetical protein
MMIVMLGILGSKRTGGERAGPSNKKRGFYLKMKISGWGKLRTV